MPNWYWTRNSGLGGMVKAVWLLVEEHRVVSPERIATEYGFGSTADCEEFLEKLEAIGVVGSIDQTALAEQMLLMDWLRAQGEIGDECVDEDGEFLHPSEQCSVEWRDCEEWKQDLRASGTVGERAYQLILWAAKGQWGGRFLENWDSGPAMNKRILAWVAWCQSIEDWRS